MHGGSVLLAQRILGLTSSASQSVHQERTTDHAGTHDHTDATHHEGRARHHALPREGGTGWRRARRVRRRAWRRARRWWRRRWHRRRSKVRGQPLECRQYLAWVVAVHGADGADDARRHAAVPDRRHVDARRAPVRVGILRRLQQQRGRVCRPRDAPVLKVVLGPVRRALRWVRFVCVRSGEASYGEDGARVEGLGGVIGATPPLARRWYGRPW